MQERHVAHQREVAALGLPRERGTDRGRDGAVDAGQAAVGDHLAAAADVVRRGHQVEVADRVRGADDEVAAGRQRAADGAGDVVRREAGRVDQRRRAAARPRRPPPARRRARRGRQVPSTARASATGVTAYGLVQAGSASSTSTSVARQQPLHRPGQRRVAEDDHPLDLVGQLGGQQQPVGPQRRPGARPAGRLGQQRPAGFGREPRAAGPASSPATTTVRGPSVERASASGSSSGRRSLASSTVRATGVQRSGGHQRIVELHVEVHEPGTDRVQRPGDVDRRDLRAEDADLVGGLVGVGAAQPDAAGRR